MIWVQKTPVAAAPVHGPRDALGSISYNPWALRARTLQSARDAKVRDTDEALRRQQHLGGDARRGPLRGPQASPKLTCSLSPCLSQHAGK